MLLSRSRALLFHAIAARLEARSHCALILFATRTSISTGHAAALLGRIEAGLGLGPVMAFVLIGRLLLLRLAVLRVDVEVIGRSGGRRARLLIRPFRRIHDRVAVGSGLPLIVDVVG